MSYPDPNKPYDIETDASNLQLGAVIKQEGVPIAFFSRKLSPAQTCYPASNKEALCIMEVLQEYHDILYGAPITIHTNHQNLMHRDLTSHCLLHWCLIIEEFAPTLVYKPGHTNVVADQLSRLPHASSAKHSKLHAKYPWTSPQEEQDSDDSIEDLELQLHEVLLHYPDDMDVFPFGFNSIKIAQQNNPITLALLQHATYIEEDFHGTRLICC